MTLTISAKKAFKKKIVYVKQHVFGYWVTLTKSMKLVSS
jgi:hypothetical protein